MQTAIFAGLPGKMQRRGVEMDWPLPSRQVLMPGGGTPCWASLWVSESIRCLGPPAWKLLSLRECRAASVDFVNSCVALHGMSMSLAINLQPPCRFGPPSARIRVQEDTPGHVLWRVIEM